MVIMNQCDYTVIGAGHGGKAMAAHLALMGFQVTLYNRNPEHIAALKAAAASNWKATKADRKALPSSAWSHRI